ncbi:hypothetical protein [Rubritalea sp.]|uniref:hypothetical protein n=1 Tax=Rubritalea sp. TaxID=2109375 RepID=UPI003EF3048D
MSPTDKLIRLAIANLNQVTSTQDKIETLRAAAELTSDDDKSLDMRLTARCLEEADQAQLKLSKLYAQN